MYVCMYVQVHLNKLECREKVFSCNLFQKVKLSYILDSLHVLLYISKVFFVLILMISAYSSWKSKISISKY